MYYAKNDKEMIPPTLKDKGYCPKCGEEVFPKLGEIRNHHWSHFKQSTCTYDDCMKFNFGKYEDMDVRDINDDGYLRWVFKNVYLTGSLAYYIYLNTNVELHERYKKPIPISPIYYDDECQEYKDNLNLDSETKKIVEWLEA